MDSLIQKINSKQMKENLPEFDVGDTVRVSTKIIEGEKERVQIFQGTVIGRQGGGLSETFSLHRVSYGEGMERVFCLHSPKIVEIKVIRKGDVCRAKLTYLRGTQGKAAKVQGKKGPKITKMVENAIDNAYDTEVTEEPASATQST